MAVSRVAICCPLQEEAEVEVVNRLARGQVQVLVNDGCRPNGEQQLLPAVGQLETSTRLDFRQELEKLGAGGPGTLVVCSSNNLAALRDACSGLHTRLVVCGDAQDGVDNICGLQDLLRLVPQSHRRERGAQEGRGAADGTLVVGYSMKASREVKLAALGMLPLVALDGVAFQPIDLDADLQTQGTFDAILHKASDFMLPVGGQGIIPEFAPSMARLQRYASEHGVTFIDPLDSLTKYIMDRQVLCEELAGLQALDTGTGTRVRGNSFVEVTSLERAAEHIAAAGLSPPCMVKPRVACGARDSHQLALLLRLKGAAGLHVPLPGVASEFVDHGAVVHKVYVIGEQVFSSQRTSIPDLRWALDHCSNAADGGGGSSADASGSLPDYINFDSLKNQFADTFRVLARSTSKPCELDMQAMRATAAWLRKHLGMHLFGFDVCVENATGDHVIVDVNYYPSFSDVPEAPAALRKAMRDAVEEDRKGARP